MEEVQLVPSKMRQTPVPSKIHQTAVPFEHHLEGEQSHRKKRRVKRKKKSEEFISAASFDIPGVTKIVLSPAVQKTLECSVGEDVTSENPWKYVSKEVIEDDLELLEVTSEFFPIKKEIAKYPRQALLLGYIPDIFREYDEFYICLTVPAEESVSELIDTIRKQQEERLYNAINKTVKPWKTLGSEKDVDQMVDLRNRPLLEVEVESEYPIMNAKCQFRLRLVQQAKDGYGEHVPGRTVYSNLHKTRIDAEVQVTKPVSSNWAQTIYNYPKNSWTQYEYEYEQIENPSKEVQENMKSFVDEEMDRLSDMIYVNSYINFYTRDYLDLIKDEKYTRAPQIAHIKEYTSFIDEQICKGKEIASLSWHPMWTGTVAVAYSDEAPSSYRTFKANADEVNAAVYDVVPVLLWSFKDTLNPTLLLETPRQVQVVSFCPFDENILVGGCMNGQIVIWDIKNRLQGVEQQEILTSEQQRYRELMYSLMRWMKNTKNTKLVRPTVVSDLEYSHGSAVTAIRWFSPFREMSRSGQIREIPEEENRRSMQFMTTGRDGAVLAWDLQAKPLMYASTYKPQRKLQRLKKRPSALTMDESPLRPLNRIFKPVFKINIPHPDNTTRTLPLASLTIRSTKYEYEEVNPDPNRKFNVTERIIYRPLFNRPTHPLMTSLIAGTTEGDFVIAGWEGFEFNAGEVVNKETAKIKNIAKYHDGPVVSLSRSELFPDLCLTVGGKVFCLWKNDLVGKPVLWRRCKHRYSQGVWNSYRPSIFRLTRSDGAVEMWHLKTRSDRYQDLTQVSGIGLTGTYTHPRSMKQNVIGVGEANGALRLFYFAHNLTQATEEDKWSTYKFCEREVIRKRHFLKWQADWLTNNAERLKAKQEQELLIQQQKEEEILKEKERMEALKELEAKQEAERVATIAKPQPGRFSEWAQQQWMIKEKDRMNQVLLGKKALDIDLLEKQQLPLTKATQEEQLKKNKQDRRLGNSNKIFEETVAMLFPDAVEKKRPPKPDPYGGGDPLDVKLVHFKNYGDIATEAQEFVNKHQYAPKFNWLDIMKAGRERRKVLDGFYSRYSHRNRIIRERQERQGDKVTVSYPRERKDVGVKEESDLGTIDYESEITSVAADSAD